MSFEWSAVAGAVNYKLLVSTSTNILDTTKYKRNHRIRAAEPLPPTSTRGIRPMAPSTTGGSGPMLLMAARACGPGVSQWEELHQRQCTYIAAPTLVSPANGASVSGTSVTLRVEFCGWSGELQAVGEHQHQHPGYHQVQAQCRSGDTGSGLPTTYNDTGYPANGTKYYWWVWAYDADGSQSLWSEVSANGRWFTNPSTYIAAPTLVFCRPTAPRCQAPQ